MRADGKSGSARARLERGETVRLDDLTDADLRGLFPDFSRLFEAALRHAADNTNPQSARGKLDLSITVHTGEAL